MKKITLSQEDYAEKFGRNRFIQSDSIKRKERIKNIDIELENWRNLKLNSEKMSNELNDRKNKIKIEQEDNKKNPERIATTKGQNLQNLENTKKQSKVSGLRSGPKMLFGKVLVFVLFTCFCICFGAYQHIYV